MPSTFSTSLRLELQATGENRSTWGVKANNVFQMIEDAVAGVISVDMGDANYALTTANGTVDEARNKSIILSTTNTATRTLTIPAVPKTYFMINQTTQTVIVSNGSNSINLLDGEAKTIITDGTAMYATNNTFTDLGTAATEDTGTSGHVLPFLDGVNTWSADQTVNGIVTATTFSGSGASLTNVPAGQLTGTVPNAAISGNYTNFADITGSGTATFNAFSGNGASISNLNMNNASAGTLAIARGGTGATTASGAFDNLKQAATTTSTGVVEKSTSGENTGGVATDVYPDVAGVKEMIDTFAVGAQTLVDDGTISSGTYTPAPTGGNWREIINGGDFTILAPTAPDAYEIVVRMTNNASAGDVVFEGFSFGSPRGDELSTDNGAVFKVYINKTPGNTPTCYIEEVLDAPPIILAPDTASSTADLSSYTFTGFANNITARDTPVIAIAIRASGNITVTSVTIGGVAATEMFAVDADGGGGSGNTTLLGWFNGSQAQTGNVVINLSGVAQTCAVACYPTRNVSSYTPSDTASAAGAGPINVDMTDVSAVMAMAYEDGSSVMVPGGYVQDVFIDTGESGREALMGHYIGRAETGRAISTTGADWIAALVIK